MKATIIYLIGLTFVSVGLGFGIDGWG